MLIIPAPRYSLAQAAWIPRITVWRDDGTIQHRQGKPGESLGNGDGGKLAARYRLTRPTRGRVSRREEILEPLPTKLPGTSRSLRKRVPQPGESHQDRLAGVQLRGAVSEPARSAGLHGQVVCSTPHPPKILAS